MGLFRLFTCRKSLPYHCSHFNFFNGILLVAKPKMWGCTPGRSSLAQKDSRTFPRWNMRRVPSGRCRFSADLGHFWRLQEKASGGQCAKITIVAFYTMAGFGSFRIIRNGELDSRIRPPFGSVIEVMREPGSTGADHRFIRWILTAVVLISSAKMMMDAFR